MQALQYKVVLGKCVVQALQCKVVLGSILCKPCGTNKVAQGGACGTK